MLKLKSHSPNKSDKRGNQFFDLAQILLATETMSKSEKSVHGKFYVIKPA